MIKIKGRWLQVIIILNLLMFVLSNVAGAIWSPQAMSREMGLSSDITVLLSHPWTLLTYMFTQWNVMHIVVNMLWLWMFWRIGSITSPRPDNRQMAVAYVVAGLSAAVIYELSCGLMSHNGSELLVGSSGAVMGLIAYVTMQAPSARVELMIFGPAKLWVIAVVTVGLCFVCDLSNQINNNICGSIAHVGGLVGGLLFALLKKRQFKPDKALNHYVGCADDEQELDAILDKVKRSGYGGLNTDERRRLFELSKRL